MDGTRAHQRILQGYGKAAARLGQPHALHRPSGPVDPVAGPALATLRAVFSPYDLLFKKAPKRTQPSFYGLWDGTQTMVGDYLVSEEDGRTWCVESQDPLLPMSTYRCDRVVSITRAGAPGLGVSDTYGGEGQSEQAILTGYPAAMTARGGGEGGIGLPGDASGGGATVLLPPVPGVVILPSDIVVDDLGRRWRVEGGELTQAGWRLHVSGAQV